MEREKEENQRAILNATEKIIAEKGIIPLTMENMAQKLILKQVPSILYFNNKESLFAAVNVRINIEIQNSPNPKNKE